MFPAPVAYPIAKLLDYVLGVHNAHTYKKAELKSFLQFHRSGEEPLRDDEISILNGVLELNTKNVEQIMTPIKVRSSFFILVVPEFYGQCWCPVWFRTLSRLVQILFLTIRPSTSCTFSRVDAYSLHDC